MDPEQFRQFLANVLLQRKRSDNEHLSMSPPTGTFVPRPVPVTYDSAHEAITKHVMDQYNVKDPKAAAETARRIMAGDFGSTVMNDKFMRAALDRYQPKGVEFNYVDPSEPRGWGYQPPTNQPFALRVAE